MILPTSPSVYEYQGRDLNLVKLESHLTVQEEFLKKLQKRPVEISLL